MDKKPPSPKTLARKQRLARALRENLKKRKAQAKHRENETIRESAIYRKTD
jgi:ribosomal protein L39E